MKTGYIVLNVLSGVVTMMFPAPVKMMAILKTWARMSMTTVLMTATVTDQVEKVKGMNLCTVTTLRETTMKKKSGLSVRFADMPGKSRKKKKNMKELTPLQAMMLLMAGQEIPEEGREVEEFSEDDDEDSDDSEAEKQSQKQHKEESLMARLQLPSSKPLHSLFLHLRYKHPPCQDHLHLDRHLLHLYSHLDHLQELLRS